MNSSSRASRSAALTTFSFSPPGSLPGSRAASPLEDLCGDSGRGGGSGGDEIGLLEHDLRSVDDWKRASAAMSPLLPQAPGNRESFFPEEGDATCEGAAAAGGGGGGGGGERPCSPTTAAAAASCADECAQGPRYFVLRRSRCASRSADMADASWPPPQPLATTSSPPVPSPQPLPPPPLAALTTLQHPNPSHRIHQPLLTRFDDGNDSSDGVEQPDAHLPFPRCSRQMTSSSEGPTAVEDDRDGCDAFAATRCFASSGNAGAADTAMLPSMATPLLADAATANSTAGRWRWRTRRPSDSAASSRQGTPAAQLSLPGVPRGGTAETSDDASFSTMLEKLGAACVPGQRGGILSWSCGNHDGSSSSSSSSSSGGSTLRGEGSPLHTNLVQNGNEQHTDAVIAAEQGQHPIAPVSRGLNNSEVVDGDDMRHHARWRADEVIPNFLFIGAARVAADQQYLLKLGITAYLCAAAELQLPSHAVAGATPATGDAQRPPPLSLRVPMTDTGKTQLVEHLDDCFAFLKRCRREGRRVLVFCREGKSRSASIAIAFLIRLEKLTFDDALRRVRQVRRVVEPNLSFCSQLHSFANRERSLSFEAPSAMGALPEAPPRESLCFASAAPVTTSTAAPAAAVSATLGHHASQVQHPSSTVPSVIATETEATPPAVTERRCNSAGLTPQSPCNALQRRRRSSSSSPPLPLQCAAAAAAVPLTCPHAQLLSCGDGQNSLPPLHASLAARNGQSPSTRQSIAVAAAAAAAAAAATTPTPADDQSKRGEHLPTPLARAPESPPPQCQASEGDFSQHSSALASRLIVLVDEPTVAKEGEPHKQQRDGGLRDSSTPMGSAAAAGVCAVHQHHKQNEHVLSLLNSPCGVTPSSCLQPQPPGKDPIRRQ